MLEKIMRSLRLIDKECVCWFFNRETDEIVIEKDISVSDKTINKLKKDFDLSSLKVNIRVSRRKGKRSLGEILLGDLFTEVTVDFKKRGIDVGVEFSRTFNCDPIGIRCTRCGKVVAVHLERDKYTNVPGKTTTETLASMIGSFIFNNEKNKPHLV